MRSLRIQVDAGSLDPRPVGVRGSSCERGQRARKELREMSVPIAPTSSRRSCRHNRISSDAFPARSHSSPSLARPWDTP